MESIPKVIHYCWFGGNPLPEKALKCINSWKKFLPEYEIIEWNESNYDVSKTPYTKEAYSCGKYAFVSDYARFDILYNHGGLYFDTDVEIIASLDDIIKRGPFMGCERPFFKGCKPEELCVNPGLGIGAYPGMLFYRKILGLYGSMHYLTNGKQDSKTVVNYTTELLCESGLKATGEVQKVDNITIYPKSYFCPMNYQTGKITFSPETCTIHHYDASWKSELRKLAKEIEWKLQWMPKPIRGYFSVFLATIKQQGYKSAFKLIQSKFK